MNTNDLDRRTEDCPDLDSDFLRDSSQYSLMERWALDTNEITVKNTGRGFLEQPIAMIVVELVLLIPAILYVFMLLPIELLWAGIYNKKLKKSGKVLTALSLITWTVIIAYNTIR